MSFANDLSAFFAEQVERLLHDGLVVDLSTGQPQFFHDSDGKLVSMRSIEDFRSFCLRRNVSLTYDLARTVFRDTSRWHALPRECFVLSYSYGPSVRHTPQGYFPVPHGKTGTTWHTGPTVDGHPTDTDHLSTFLDMLCLDSAGKAAMVGYLAGLILRCNFSAFPLLVVHSPYKNVGKSTLARLAAAIYYNRPDPFFVDWNGEEDFAKRFAAQVSSNALAVIDNVDPTASTGGFSSHTIAVATQAGGVSLRVLGKSEAVEISNPSFVLTLQAGWLSNDLMDRSLYVLFREDTTKRPRTADATDFVTEHYLDIRDELVWRIVNSTPDAMGAGSYRFKGFRRHVAPIIRSYGLPDAAIETRPLEAHPRTLAFYELLAAGAGEEFKKISEIVSMIATGPDELRAVIPMSAAPDVKSRVLAAFIGTLPESVPYQGFTRTLVRKKVGPQLVYRIKTTTSLEELN